MKRGDDVAVAAAKLLQAAVVAVDAADVGEEHGVLRDVDVLHVAGLRNGVLKVLQHEHPRAEDGRERDAPQPQKRLGDLWGCRAIVVLLRVELELAALLLVIIIVIICKAPWPSRRADTPRLPLLRLNAEQVPGLVLVPGATVPALDRPGPPCRRAGTGMRRCETHTSES